MNFLSIDCSTEVGSLFVKVQNKTFSKVLQSDKSSNDLLMKRILDFFIENDLKINDITQIFVNQGPGNFSSLRGSLSTAKGISLSKNLNLSGYDTFIWSCAEFINKKESIYSIIKFREEYFIKNFSKNLNVSSIFKKVSKDEIMENYDNKFKVIPKILLQNIDKNILKLSNLSIVDLDHNQLKLLQLKGLLNENLIKPLYLG